MSSSSRTALTTGLLTLAAFAFAPGCTGILGLNAGKASDGSVGAPCDVNTPDSPTLCQSGTTTCVLHVCRSVCTADSSCAPNERCLAADNGNGGGFGGGSSSGFGGFGSSSGFSGGGSGAYGCVPITSTTCGSQSDCGSNRTCDSSGQCRTSCFPNQGCSSCTTSCASDQTCTDMGAGITLCYGPHDSYVADGSTGDDGSSGASSSGGSVACTGTLKYGSCAQCASTCSSCVGCSGGSAGYCSGTASSCAQCGTSYGCSATSCPDCVVGSGPSCSGTPTYDCSSSLCQSSTYCSGINAGYCQGCTWTSGGTCLSYRYTCASIASIYGTAACPASGCIISGSTCVGTPTTCSTFTDSNSCANSYDCYWSTSGGSCTGTATACSAYTTSSTCSQVYGCSYSSSTPCTGTPPACSSLTSASQCQMRQGCNWFSNTPSSCTGTITPCGLLSASNCTSQPGCSLVTGGSSSGGGSSGGGSSGVIMDASACGTTMADGAPVCNCLTPTGPAVGVTTTKSLPSLTGGVVQPGTYVLQSEQAYISGFPGGTGLTVETVRDTIQISGTSMQRATNVTGGGPGGSLTGMGSGLSTSTATFTAAGSSFTAYQSCPGAAVMTGTYEASAGSLTLETQVATDAGLTVYFIGNYTLQPGG